MSCLTGTTMSSANIHQLIEGLSGIKVPRSKGTCTRCPLEITLLPSSSEQDTTWSCDVELQHKFSFNPDASLDGHYGKWHEVHNLKPVHFATVNDKDELENVISRAQHAVLNPGDDPLQYLHASSINKMPMKVEFSPNKVILTIRAPGQPSLSFIDLPGIVEQMGVPGGKWLVRLVKNFVTDHINEDNALILLARSMEVDFSNSSGAALIDDCGALARTVGCLTKPDRWPPGGGSRLVQDVLEGTAFAVGHGYFVAKQPNQLELDSDLPAEKARESEDGFFAQAPWSTELHDFRNRFGTFKLRDFLSHKLTDQIQVALPNIIRNVNSRLGAIDAELAGYPDPPENALGKVLEALSDFKALVEKNVQGIFPHNEMRNMLRNLDTTFQSDLEKLRPGLSKYTPVVVPEMINLLSDEDDPDQCSPTPSNKRRINFGTPAAKRFKVEPGSRDSSAIPSTTKSKGKAKGKGKLKTLQDVRETLATLSAFEIPNEVDPVAINHLRKEMLVGWDGPTMAYINSVQEEIQTTLDQLLEQACAQWLNTAFFKDAKQIVRAFVCRIISEQMERAEEKLVLEQRKPSTIDIEAYEYHSKEELKILEEARMTRRLKEKFEATDRASGRDDNQKRLEKFLKDTKARAELGPDPYDEEVKIMAKVRGYHRVALLRFVDQIIRRIHVLVLHELEYDLPQELKTGLGVENHDAQERCKELLAEDREREIRRKELQVERSNFVEAQRKLAAIGQRDQGVALDN